MNTQFKVPDLSEQLPSDDELALGRIEEVIWSSRARLRNEPEFASGFRTGLCDCLDLLCPGEVDGDDVLSVVTSNISKVPAGQLNALSTLLLDAASKSADAKCSRSAAVCLLAGWLKAAAIQSVGEKSVRRAAQQLKRDCELLFERLLREHKAAA